MNYLKLNLFYKLLEIGIWVGNVVTIILEDFSEIFCERIIFHLIYF